MTCCHTSSGDPDCTIRACRTRWLVGTTTCEPYRPSRVRSLIGDVLETWSGHWFAEPELVSHIHQIRPRIRAGTVDRELRWLRQAEGVDVAGCWVTVEFQPTETESVSTAMFGWTMRARPR